MLVSHVIFCRFLLYWYHGYLFLFLYSQLLRKNPADRLGDGPDDAATIKVWLSAIVLCAECSTGYVMCVVFYVLCTVSSQNELV